MDMDTSEITTNRIVEFQWDDPGTDLEDEMSTPVLSPVQIVAPVIPPAGTADPFGRGDGFDLDLAKVMLDVAVMPSMISPLEECEVPPPSRAAEYAAPAIPALETVLESPGGPGRSPGGPRGVSIHVDTGVRAGFQSRSGGGGGQTLQNNRLYFRFRRRPRHRLSCQWQQNRLHRLCRRPRMIGGTIPVREVSDKWIGRRCLWWKRWRGPPQQRCVKVLRTSVQI